MKASVYIGYSCDHCVAQLSVVSQSFKICVSYLVFLCLLRCLLTFSWFVADRANVGYLNRHRLYSVQRCCTSFSRGASSARHDVHCRGTGALSDSFYGGGDPLCQVLDVFWFSCVYRAYHKTPQQHITGRYRLSLVAAVEDQHTRRPYPPNFVRHEY
jgi:hypothetical protein